MRSRDVAHLAGITYRQLDYLTRHPQTPLRGLCNGSGSYRQWTPHQAIRITLAAHLTNATIGSGDGGSPFNTYAFALLTNPHPIPPTGWLACNTQPDAQLEISFADNPIDLMATIETMRSALVTAYDLHEILTANRPRHLNESQQIDYAMLVVELVDAAGHAESVPVG